MEQRLADCDAQWDRRIAELRVGIQPVRADLVKWVFGAQRGCRVHCILQEPESEAFVKTANPVVHSDPGILGGTPVFVGTRVPVQSLFDYLEAGDSLDEFLHQFPSVKREQAVAALELARDALVTGARTP